MSEEIQEQDLTKTNEPVDHHEQVAENTLNFDEVESLTETRSEEEIIEQAKEAEKEIEEANAEDAGSLEEQQEALAKEDDQKAEAEMK